MKNIFLLLCLGFSLNLMGQDITYKITPPQTIYADSFDHVYRFFSYLSNNTNDSIAIKYVRVVKDVTSFNIFNGLCTDILCYYVSLDTIIELIPPMTTHKIESRWQVVGEDIVSGRGYSEWELSINDTKTVIDTFKTEFIYNMMSTATKDLDLKVLSINPNPVHDLIRFSESNLEDVQVYSMNGQLLMSKPSLNGNVLDVSVLKTGQYIGVAEKGSQRYNFRFVKSE